VGVAVTRAPAATAEEDGLRPATENTEIVGLSGCAAGTAAVTLAPASWSFLPASGSPVFPVAC